MLHELSFGGLLFSPLVVLVPIAFGMAAITRLMLHRLNLRRYIWKEPWFDLALFVCYLAGIVYFFGN